MRPLSFGSGWQTAEKRTDVRDDMIIEMHNAAMVNGRTESTSRIQVLSALRCHGVPLL